MSKARRRARKELNGVFWLGCIGIGLGFAGLGGIIMDLGVVPGVYAAAVSLAFSLGAYSVFVSQRGPIAAQTFNVPRAGLSVERQAELEEKWQRFAAREDVKP